MPRSAQALCDTGPLVALADRTDSLHDACREALEGFAGDLVTTWPVLSEAFYFLDRPYHRALLWDVIMDGGIRLADISPRELSRMRTLMDQYADLPMDFADASLVALAERLSVRRVFTLDRRDFHVYRPRHVRSFEVFP